MKRIAILGSTGSIGTQALEVVREHADKFSVELLVAQNSWELLVKQAIEFSPNSVVIGNRDHYQKVSDALSGYDIKVFTGKESIEESVVSSEIDMVLSAMVGFAGLKPTLKAIEVGKAIALANKETLVVAGELVTEAAIKNKVPIIPVDSEHSAIFQCIVGEHSPIEKVILTASGGPFRNHSMEQLRSVSKADALNHPNWCMGQKITVDSASLMNKGLEVIEAKWLFGLQPEQIEVVIHPQSIVHSMVQFVDGSIKAQMGLPDMKLPIQYAFTFPNRVNSNFPRMDFSLQHTLTFEKPDTERFPSLSLAIESLKKGGNMPCVLNAANEVAVEAFLNEQIGFMAIPKIVEKLLSTISYIERPTLNDYLQTDSETRIKSYELIKHHQLIWK
ncbi:1-deoxy-D-xylulose-5-phosphate reductoisomerase [Tenuifilum thalassicum]|uniref:1-deoxy-D-xylulose 5-phosphate reductoisomerase n=1 Tax=Tenuifilum thalassicum TaxID=2590900 RepID=A0A7D4BIP9_9BACT|nr:1-deoxy-D-xylulose-5-phosphate reductoisomerase [Tenuifilum thalassicum]QKG78939.1 1-deoxy-D-xylulose-5-phosphate reductoisomerase [Tenuifilum thalassicum]